MATNQIPITDALNPVYPSQPGYCKNCGVNSIYQTLPENPSVGWEIKPFNTTVKHLYTGIPNYYPVQTITRPVGTLYEHDFSQMMTSGASYGKRLSYQPKYYPFTNRNVKEFREYSDEILPYMDWRNWTKHPIKRDSSVNSDLHQFPNPYIQDRNTFYG